MNNKLPLTKYALTGAVVLIAALAVLWKYWAYVTNPWTRDGQVRANVIQVAPRVSGPIVKLPIKDNQLVMAGDLLFEIDPRTYQAAMDQASANLDETRDRLKDLEQQVKAAEAAVDQAKSRVPQAESLVDSAEATLEKAKKDFQRASDLVSKGDVSKRTFDEAKADLAKAQAQQIQANAALLQAQAELARAKAELGAPGEENAQLRAPKAALETAKLNLEFTRMRASVDGYVTNLNLRLGSQAVANQPALALVDSASFWVHGYFRETMIADVNPGNRAVITLMTYSDRPLEGRVDSIGWGISQSDGSTGYDLLPMVSPTFQWIRLAQRIPVRVHLEDVPDGVELRVGTTASVLVMTDSGGKDSGPIPAVPRALQ